MYIRSLYALDGLLSLAICNDTLHVFCLIWHESCCQMYKCSQHFLGGLHLIDLLVLSLCICDMLSVVNTQLDFVF